MSGLEPAFLGIDSVREVVQALVNGIVAGSGYAMLGIGLALIFGVAGRFHFALASTYMLTVFLAAVAVVDWGLPLVPAIGVGLTVGVLVGVAIEALIYQPLDRRAAGNSLLPVFVASLGVVIAIENLVRLIWDSNPRNLTGFPAHNFTVADVNFTLAQAMQVTLAMMIVLALTLILTRSVLGQQMRAVRGNPEMAAAVGVDVNRIYLVVFAIGTLIAGVAAISTGLRFAVSAGVGNAPIFYAFVVVFLAGAKRSPLVVGAVGIGIGIVESLSTIWLSQNLSAITVFGLLFVYLTARSLPQGIRQLSGALSLANRVRPRGQPTSG